MSATARHGVLFLLIAFGAGQAVAEASRAGQPLRDAIATLSQQGLKVLYSDELVHDDYRVLEEPDDDDPEQALREVLRPWGLTLDRGPAGSLLIVRDDRAGPRDDARLPLNVAPADEPLPEIVTTATVYSLRYQSPAVQTFLDRDLTAALPDLGDEPLRALWRLPGTASGGVSTRHHVRGGVPNEQLFLLDGLRLYEPHHLKDFHQVATIVDQNAIAGIDFYASAYPVRFGDRMSGVVDLELREPPEEAATELGLSLFSTSLLSMGRFGGHDRGDWLFSARRGNLDLIANILDPAFGSPRYEDVLMRVGWALSDRTRISANLLYSFDRITIAERDGSESAKAKYRNSIAWLKAETDWNESLGSEMLIGITDIANDGSGQKNVPGTISGFVDDSSDFRAVNLTQHWRLDARDWLTVSVGAELKRLDAVYRYDAERIIATPFAGILDNAPLTVTSITVDPSGAQYSAYINSRWRLFDYVVADIGLRWDQQTYTTAADDKQLSPRIGLLYRVGERTDLRFGTGLFYQAQEINELQIGDGIEEFFPAQRSLHLVAGISHRFAAGIDLRLEWYRKKYSSLMPRFENVFDPLVLIPELQIDRVRIDAETALARGVELTITGERNDLQWWFSYARARIEERTAADDVARSWDQRNTLKAGLSVDWQPWSFSAAGIWHSGWPATTLQGETITNPDGSAILQLTPSARNSQRFASFHSLDVRVSREFPVSKGELEGFVEISNLYNQGNPCCTRYRSSIGDDGTPVLTAKQGNWLPLVPSIGVRWRF